MLRVARKTEAFASLCRSFSTSEAPKRPVLKPLPRVPQNMQQLKTQHEGEQILTEERRKLLNIQETDDTAISTTDISPLKMLSNSWIAKKLGWSNYLDSKNTQLDKFITSKTDDSDLTTTVRQANQAGSIPVPPPRLARVRTCSHLINLWDPKLRTPELATALQNSGVTLDDMDLVGDSLSGAKVSLRQSLVQRNKVSLVVVSSSELANDHGIILQNLWANEYRGLTTKNHDGRINTEALHVCIFDGLIARVIHAAIKRNLRSTVPEHLHRSTLVYMGSSEKSPIIRARRFMDVSNRFMTHVLLVDERGLVRWRSGMSGTPTPQFLESLFKVTGDLVLETQYDEAD